MSGAPTVAMGTMLAARWIVGAPLGIGENGEVYEAEEAQGGRLCAVKILHPELRRGGPSWSTFQSEVRAVSALPADAVARVYDLGIDGKLHRAFVVCERVMFPSLARHVAERGPLPAQIFQEALASLARALDAMHAAGVTHGSIKPQNIFVSAEHPSWARLTDYGLARLRMAVDPKYAGTPGWAPPELTPGVHPQPSGDLFALGMIAFFALTGMPWLSVLGARDHRLPAMTTAASTRARELGGHLDPAFDVWFKAALAADPAARYTSATEMAKSFSALVESLDVSTEGPLSGPGVATAIARPLLFLRDLPQSAPAEPQAPPEPAPSVAHPFSPTVPVMPAIQQALDAQAQAFAAQAAQATAPTAPAMPAITAPSYSPAPQYAPAATFAAAPPAVAATQISSGSALERASGLSRPQLVGVAVAGLVLLLLAAAAAAVFVLRTDEPAAESTAAPAPSLPATSAAPAVEPPAQAPAPAPAPSPEPPEPAATAPQPAAPAAVQEPAPAQPAPKPVVTPKPVVAPAAPKPASTPKPASAPAKPKKCGTFINPCK